MSAVTRKFAANTCLATFALLIGGVVRGFGLLDPIDLPVPVADTAGALAWLTILTNARARQFWDRVFTDSNA